ncbi:hypothetical protein YPPY32_3287, partial [Yersinia pestis PY-32]|jgi:hypothetical protein
MATV